MAREYLTRGDMQNCISNINKAAELNSGNQKVLDLITEVKEIQSQKDLKTLKYKIKKNKNDSSLHFELGSFYHGRREWKKAVKYYEKAYKLDRNNIQARVLSIFVRTIICKWGKDGIQYEEDMLSVEQIIKSEIEHSKLSLQHNMSEYGPSINPHSALGYNIDPMLKKFLAVDYARSIKVQMLKTVNPLTAVTNHSLLLDQYRDEAIYNMTIINNKNMNNKNKINNNRLYKYNNNSYVSFNIKPNFRIRIGYIASSLKTKAFMTLVQDMIRFHDRNLFEIYVYTTYFYSCYYCYM
jgi:predicted O-linked N-acetylglucosamine transferase (SPINDLY family)